MQSREDLPVCVIGCGFAGLSMCRQLLAHKIPFVAYDQAPEIGGLWRGGVKQMYEGLSTNLPLQFMAFGGASPPPLSPMFCGKEEVMKYLKSFVSECKLDPFLRLNTAVVDAHWTGSAWRVKTQPSASQSLSDSCETKEFRSVIVCSGHFHEPLMGALDGFEKFSGKVIHSSEFISASTFSADQRVLVVGTNSSGSDIATMLRKKGCDVHVYMRTGSATPEAVKVRLSQRPKNAGCVIHRCPPQFLGSNKVGFDQSNLPSITPPSMPFFQRMFFKLITPPLGPSIPKKNVQHNVESKSAYEFDTVVLATGYRYTFPFLNNEALGLLSGHGIVTSQLFEHMFYIPNPTLVFLGLGNALVPPSTVFHFQALLVARLLTHKCKLPAALEPSKFPWWLGFQTPQYCNALARLAGLRTGYWWDFFVFKFWRLVLSALFPSGHTNQLQILWRKLLRF